MYYYVLSFETFSYSYEVKAEQAVDEKNEFEKYKLTGFSKLLFQDQHTIKIIKNMDDEREEIECDEHGPSYSTFMCGHLVTGSGLGFYCSVEDDDPYPDAWCAQCNKVMLEENGWNDRSEAYTQIKLVCHHCYSNVKSRNQIKMSEADFASLLDESYDYLNTQINQVNAEYKIGSYERFDFDDERGEIIFSDQGTPKVIAEYQNVGSVSTITNTWLWAWANESIPAHTKNLVRNVRSYGETHALERLTTAKWNADEVDGWEMTAITAKLLSAKGYYRAPTRYQMGGSEIEVRKLSLFN